MNKTISTYHIGMLEDMDATEVANKIKNGECTAAEAVQCATDRAMASQDALNAVVFNNYKGAMESSYNHEGIFAGVPTFIKDLNDVKGLPTLKGSAAFNTKPARKNDKIVDQILSVTGAIVLGKSSTSEFGLLPCGETLQHGETKNPWNTGYSTGGSSAGAAALVAAGVVPFAHASDGGGSIRIPASCCGLVGLKPSRGRNITSRTAIAPVNIAEDGIVTRTVRDTANYYAELEKYYKHPSLPSIGQVTHAGKKRLHIGLFTKSSAGMEAHGDVHAVGMHTGRLMESAGHHVSYIDNPFKHSVTRDFLVYWSFLSFASMISEFSSNGFAYRHSKAAKFTKQIGAVFPLLSIQAIKSIRNLKAHTADYDKLFETYDILVSPVLSHPAPPIGHFGAEVDTLEIIMKLNSYVNFTTTQNITGAPAISLPMGLSKDGLPIGVQFAAKTGEEKKLLQLAFEMEDVKRFITLAELERSAV
jgi:amidase